MKKIFRIAEFINFAFVFVFMVVGIVSLTYSLPNTVISNAIAAVLFILIPLQLYLYLANYMNTFTKLAKEKQVWELAVLTTLAYLIQNPQDMDKDGLLDEVLQMAEIITDEFKGLPTFKEFAGDEVTMPVVKIYLKYLLNYK